MAFAIDYQGAEKVLEDGVKDFTEKVGEKGTEKGTEKISKNQQLILDKIASNSHITIDDLVAVVGISASKIKANIAKLKAAGKIERIGSDKGGYWKIIN